MYTYVLRPYIPRKLIIASFTYLFDFKAKKFMSGRGYMLFSAVLRVLEVT